jgi:hypothetical protein
MEVVGLEPLIDARLIFWLGLKIVKYVDQENSLYILSYSISAWCPLLLFCTGFQIR